MHREAWPKYDPKKLIASTVTIAVQVNGKTRTTVSVPAQSSESEAVEAAKTAAQQWIGESAVSRAIYVPQRLVNLVLAKQ